MNVGIIGCGNLGSAVARLISKNLSFGDHLTISDPNSSSKQLKELQNFKKVSNRESISSSDILFLCTKPTDIVKVLDDINSSHIEKNISPPSDQLIVSCAAGISLNYLQACLDLNYPIIRMMTNLPIAHHQGAITYITGPFLPKETISSKFIEIMKGPMLLRVGNEKLLDVSTVLTGCMPAYTAFLSEEMIEFGISQGFTYEQSRDLYRATVTGTMEMLKHSTSEEIIDAVSSPNGVTAQGISFLETSGIRAILSSTMYKSYSAISSLSSIKNQD